MIRDILSHELLNRIVVQGMKSFSVELPSDPIRGLCLPYNCQATLLLMDSLTWEVDIVAGRILRWQMKVKPFLSLEVGMTSSDTMTRW